MASEDQVSQLLKKLEEISERQDKYQAMCLSNTEYSAVFNDSVADEVNIQWMHLSQISRM